MKLFDEPKLPTQHEVIMWAQTKEIEQRLSSKLDQLRMTVVGATWLLIINSWLIVGVVLMIIN
jgi:hypothetical protein